MPESDKALLLRYARDPSPDPVVVHRQPEQTDLEVAEAHDGVGVGPDRESALWLESVVDDQLAALQVELAGA